MGCSAAEAEPFTARTSLASSEGLFLLLFSGDCWGPDLQQMSNSCFFLCWSHQWRVITVARWSCSFIHQSDASLRLQSSEGCKMLTSWQALIRPRHLSSSSIFFSGCVKASVYVRFHVHTQNSAAPGEDFVLPPLEAAIAAIYAQNVVATLASVVVSMLAPSNCTQLRFVLVLFSL